MNKLIPHLLAGAIAAGALTTAGCTVGVAADPVYADATVVGPELAYVSPGVWVVQDYYEPVFFHSNYYWVNRGGIWYRSGRYNGGWVRAYNAPVSVRSVRNPRRYVRYRAPRGTRTWRPAARNHRVNHRNNRVHHNRAHHGPTRVHNNRVQRTNTRVHTNTRVNRTNNRAQPRRDSRKKTRHHR